MENKPKILIVDDRIENLVALERILSDIDVKCVRALSGNEALTRLIDDDFALVLIDVQMPDMDGFETVELLRQDKRNQALPVIFVSAIYKEDHYQIRGLETGAVDFITKPIVPQILLGKVRALLELYDYRKALEESEARYRDLFENASDLIQSVDAEGRFVYVNSAWLEALGYERDQVEALRFADILTPNQKDTCTQLFQNVMDGQQFDNLETTFVTRDGHELFVEGNIGARIENGKFVATRGIFRDVTTRKIAEEKARELDRMKSDFISNVSHELRTPLHSIKGFTKLMLDGKVSDPSNQTEFLNIIDKESEHLGELIEDLLDVSRLESGRFSIEKNRFHPEEVIHSAVERIRGFAGERGISVYEDIPETLPEVEADQKRIGQVITNLLSNAIKYNKENGSVTVRSEVRHDDLLVQVIDEGIGIKEEDMPNLFDRFYRVEASNRIEGTGLGLYISQQILEAHGGSMRAESTPGEGSTFSFTLPLEQAETNQ